MAPIFVQQLDFNTRWFKYDRDWLCVNKSQFVPVIFEPPCKKARNKNWNSGEKKFLTSDAGHTQYEHKLDQWYSTWGTRTPEVSEGILGVKSKVKLSRYRPEQAHGDPVG
jgi:hypothetical protein